jgi:hypothetical protein
VVEKGSANTTKMVAEIRKSPPFFYLAERKSGFRETPAKHSCFQFLSARKYVRGPKIAQFDARLT